MIMETQFAHAALPPASADDLARQAFVQSLKLHLARKVVPDIQTVYERRVEPAFIKAHGRPPATPHEVKGVMDDEYQYRLWGSLYRTAQELLWNSVLEPVSRNAEAMAASAHIENPIGSLTLDPALEIPRYVSAVDIHCMPGGYQTERFEGDVTAGALYDRGVHIYGMGGLGARSDRMGQIISRFLATRFPALQAEGRPLRILDLGCSVGHSTLPYAEAFPGAEIHAIDVGAPMLRYAHARAEAMGVPVHFHQMNAEALAFPDDHFDIVVSHILFHETSNRAIRNILKESRRVAKPGGIVIHVEMCFLASLTPFNGFMMLFDGPNNNEPFWETYRKMDPHELMASAGFAPDSTFFQQFSRAYDGQTVFSAGVADAGRGTWQLLGAVK
jgi:SAM-dependent methyltransferase